MIKITNDGLGYASDSITFDMSWDSVFTVMHRASSAISDLLRTVVGYDRYDPIYKEEEIEADAAEVEAACARFFHHRAH